MKTSLFLIVTLFFVPSIVFGKNEQIMTAYNGALTYEGDYASYLSADMLKALNNQEEKVCSQAIKAYNQQYFPLVKELTKAQREPEREPRKTPQSAYSLCGGGDLCWQDREISVSKSTKVASIKSSLSNLDMILTDCMEVVAQKDAEQAEREASEDVKRNARVLADAFAEKDQATIDDQQAQIDELRALVKQLTAHLQLLLQQQAKLVPY